MAVIEKYKVLRYGFAWLWFNYNGQTILGNNIKGILLRNIGKITPVLWEGAIIASTHQTQIVEMTVEELGMESVNFFRLCFDDSYLTEIIETSTVTFADDDEIINVLEGVNDTLLMEHSDISTFMNETIDLEFEKMPEMELLMFYDEVEFLKTNFPELIEMEEI